MQLLDDDKDMADLYLTRKLLQAQHPDSPLLTIYSDDGGTASSAASRKLARLSSLQSHGHTSRRSNLTHTTGTGYDVEKLEMLLEAYFMQVSASLNRLYMVSSSMSFQLWCSNLLCTLFLKYSGVWWVVSFLRGSKTDMNFCGRWYMQVREYISDTEDYINVQLDHQRNQLFQFHITVSASALAVAVAMGLVGMVSMNIPIPPYNSNNWFTPFVCCVLFIATIIFFSVIGYVRWTGLFEK